MSDGLNIIIFKYLTCSLDVLKTIEALAEEDILTGENNKKIEKNHHCFLMLNIVPKDVQTKGH